MKPTALLILSIALVILCLSCVSASPVLSQRMGPGGVRGYVDLDDPDPEYVLEMLARLGQSILNNEQANSKRGLDLGMSRGFSGSQAAKHLMGLAAANFAGGPGRRRREALLDK